MDKKIRYGDFLGAVRLKQRAISFNEVVAYTHAAQRRVRLRPRDAYRLLAPYIGVRFAEQLQSVAPLVLFLVFFEFVVLHQEILSWQGIAAGIALVIVGLMFFIEGIKQGLMPFSENIGYTMPGSFALRAVLFVAFVLGFMATLAEPAIGALKAAGSVVSGKEAPYLHRLLNQRADLLVMAVGFGVGVAVLLGMLRFMLGWSLKSMVMLTMVPCLVLTLFLALDQQLDPLIGLAWDCGAITTGPVTVPMVLALGIGVSAATSREDNPLSGFGIVTLASLFPPIMVMSLGIVLALDGASAGSDAMPSVQAAAWFESTPYAEIMAALRAILPLTLFLWLVQRWWLKSKVRDAKIVTYGIVLAILGMMLFNLGLSYGLAPLGQQAGRSLPSAFSTFSEVAGTSIPAYWIGVGMVLLFAAMLGFGATVAEPALSAMGMTVQNLTDGVFRKKALIYAVAAGVAIGTAMGVIKVIFALPMAMMLVPTYLVAMALTALSSEEYVNLAWDSAGVTTGPVTVPLVLAMGLGLGHAVGAKEGFGILAMASVGPIISVLLTGLWMKWRVEGRFKAMEKAGEV